MMDEIDAVRFVVSDDVERYFRECSPEFRGESVGIGPDAIGGRHFGRIGDCGGVDPRGDVGGDVDGAVTHDGVTIARHHISRQRNFFRRRGENGAKPMAAGVWATLFFLRLPGWTRPLTDGNGEHRTY